MAEPDSDQDDKTEAPTPRRMERAREEGQAAVSHEVAGFAGLVGAALALSFLVPPLATRLAGRLAAWLETPGLADGQAALSLLSATFWPMLWLLLGVALMVAVPAVGAHLLQTGMLVSAAQLKPRWARISPLAGLKRLVSPETLMQFAKSIVKLAVLGLVVWHVLAGDLPRLAASAAWPPEGLLAAAAGPFGKVLAATLAVLAVITLIDVLFTRMRHTRQLRMSRQDLRQEMKDAEGDPHLKARVRRIRQERARKRMMADVKTAAVVVTNPTHFAVALAYDRGRDAAPRIVAKGADAVAARIRAEAEAHGVPLYSNPPLARALFTIELGQSIPAEHYQAVAEIIAYVWGLRGRMPRPGAAAGR